LKISESVEKIPNPGNKKVWRVYDKSGKATADLVTLADENPQNENEICLHHPMDSSKKRILTKDQISKVEKLLFDILVDGKLVYDFPSIEEIRKIKQNDIDCLDSGVRRLIFPHTYHVSLSQKLWDLKQNLIRALSTI